MRRDRRKDRGGPGRRPLALARVPRLDLAARVRPIDRGRVAVWFSRCRSGQALAALRHSAERPLCDRPALLDRARAHRVPARGLLPRAAIRGPVGHYILRRHTASPRTALRDGVSLGDGLSPDRPVASTGALRPALRALPRQLRGIQVLHRVPPRDTEGVRRPVRLPDHEPRDDRRGLGRARSTFGAAARSLAKVEARSEARRMSMLKVVNKILLALAIVFLGLFVFAGLVLGACFILAG